MFFKAQAVIAAGSVRGTADIDITVDDLPVASLRAAFHKAGFLVEVILQILIDSWNAIAFYLCCIKKPGFKSTLSERDQALKSKCWTG